jgi:hypothetical protein
MNSTKATTSLSLSLSPPLLSFSVSLSLYYT